MEPRGRKRAQSYRLNRGRKAPILAQTVATTCHRLPGKAHGK